MAEETPEAESTPVEMETPAPASEPEAVDFDSTGDAALDEQLSKPAIEGLKGIDTAQVWISGFLIVIAGVIAYSNAFSIPFQYLDQIVIQQNPDAHRIATVPQALDVEPSAPLPMLTFAVNWAISGGTPGLFHAVNILLHVLNALLVYLLCRRLLRAAVPEPVPMLAGLFVALNPLATESVDYIVGRSVLMGTFFSLLSVYLLIRAAEKTERLPAGHIALSLLAMAFAWYCGFSAALIPLLILSADWVAHGTRAFRRAPVHAAYWALLGVLVIAWYAGHDHHVPFDHLVSGAPDANSADRAAAFMRGLQATVSPVALTPDYNLPPRVSLDEPSVHVGLTVFNGMVLAGAAIVLLAFRSMAGFALFWFVAGLAWSVFSFSAAEPFSERGLYFPLCGIVMVVPWLMAKASARRVTQIVAAAAAVILLLAAGSGTFMRNRVWQDTQLLWQDAAAKAPSSPLPYERLGSLYYERGFMALQQAAVSAQQGQGPAAAASQEEARQLLAAAEESLTAALDRSPGNPDTIYRLGRCAGFLGRGDEAIDRIQEALRLDPGNFEYTTQLALNLMVRANQTGTMNDRLRSIDYFRHAEELGQLPPEVRTQFAGALAAIGDLGAAERELGAIVATAEYPPAAQQLEQVRRTIAYVSQLEGRARELLSSDADSQEGLRLQAEVFMGRGKLLQASYLLDRLLSRYPDDANSWILMGVARAFVNDEQGFLSQWPNAPPAAAGEPSAWLQLARRCATTGRWDAARTYLESAAGRAPEVALPLVSLAEIAISMNALSVATEYLDEATRQYADSPKAWLLLCDIAVTSDNLPAARRYLAEAEKRGAAPDEVEQRRAKAGTGPAEEQDDFTTILR